jgi:hypothetical protein
MLCTGDIEPYDSGSRTKCLVLVPQRYTPLVPQFFQLSTRVPRPDRPIILVTVAAMQEKRRGATVTDVKGPPQCQKGRGAVVRTYSCDACDYAREGEERWR